MVRLSRSHVNSLEDEVPRSLVVCAPGGSTRSGVGAPGHYQCSALPRWSSPWPVGVFRSSAMLVTEHKF
jgi:hypothetical protein